MEQLLTVLRDREIPLDRNDVQWAFKSSTARDEATAWTQEYLQTASLLSKNEHDLHLKVNRGMTNRLPEGSLTAPVYDDELLDAISALESSTATIEKQTETLDAQRDALLALVAQSDEISPQAERANTTRNRRRAQEAGHLNFDVEELSASVKDQLLMSQKQTTNALQSLTAYASDRLSLDNRKLEAMSDLSSKIDPISAHRTDQKVIKQWCQALITFRALEIKTRVETIYHTKLAESQNGAVRDGDAEPHAEKEALEAELQSLRDEIASVAEMVVDHDLRLPIFTSVQNSERSREQWRQAWLAY
ncbi:hypothetical protein LTS18_000677, partial [Coniosporium uncinatum]